MMYVSVTQGMRGYFAVLIDETNGFPEPVQTGIGSYASFKEAKIEAQEWARIEGIEYK